MTCSTASIRILALCGLELAAGSAYGQGTLADYERAAGLREKFQSLAPGVLESASWIESTSRFWYRKAVPGGHEFELVDAATLARRPAFDHEKLAAALSKAAGESFTARKLPFREIAFADHEQAIEFSVMEDRWKARLADYVCEKSAVRDRDRVAVAVPPVPHLPSESVERKASPNGAWEAWVRNYNLFLRSKTDKKERRLSFDGSEDNAYDISTFR